MRVPPDKYTAARRRARSSPRARTCTGRVRASLTAAIVVSCLSFFQSTNAHARCLSVGVDLDEHLLVDPPRDEDYAGGLAVFLASTQHACGGRMPLSILGKLDHLFGIGAGSRSINRQTTDAVGGGLTVFTPANLRATSPNPGDRPYASLLYFSATRRVVNTRAQVAVDSTWTIGLLGLGVGRDLQNVLHDVTGSQQAMGWRHQISAGGELTAKFGVARQALWWRTHLGRTDIDLKWSALANVGTVTDAGVAWNLRVGRIRSPWWAYTPEQNTYTDDFAAIPRIAVGGADWELFAMAGARLRARAYDAFLQGQFRHSDLRYPLSALRPVLADAWFGLQWNVAHLFDLRYLARIQTAELRNGPGARTLIWGSLEIEHSFCGC